MFGPMCRTLYAKYLCGAGTPHLGLTMGNPTEKTNLVYHHNFPSNGNLCLQGTRDGWTKIIKWQFWKGAYSIFRHAQIHFSLVRSLTGWFVAPFLVAVSFVIPGLKAFNSTRRVPRSNQRFKDYTAVLRAVLLKLAQAVLEARISGGSREK